MPYSGRAVREVLKDSWEIDLEALHDRQAIAQQLDRDDVQNTLETIDRARNDDSLVVLLIEDESLS